MHTVEIVNIGDLARVYNDWDVISVESLFEKGLIKHPLRKIKILWNGVCDKKFQFEGIELFSESAESVKKGGTTKKAKIVEAEEVDGSVETNENTEEVN